MTNPEDFAWRMRQARALRGLSQAELSRISEVNPATVHRLETGQTKAHKGTVGKIARALRVSPEWLQTGAAHLAPSETPSPNGAARSVYRYTVPPEGELPQADLDGLPSSIPTAIVLLTVKPEYAELWPITVEELGQLVQQWSLSSGALTTRQLELQLWILRMAGSGVPDPKVIAAFQRATSRHLGTTAEPRQSAPTSPAKRRRS